MKPTETWTRGAEKGAVMMKTFADRRVTILGLGREGMALTRFMAKRGAQVIVSDRRGLADLADEIGQLAGLPVTCVLRDHPEDILETDILFVSPGIPRSVPIVRAAEARGVPVSSLTELFFELCRAPIVGITGSAGKTTTTTLIGEMLKTDRRRKTWVGGNIGRPLIEEVDDIRAGDWVVLELSSFQLEHLHRSPHVAVVTNVRPNHLDRHGTFEAYRDAKANILRHQSADDVAVLNWDDPETRALAELAPGRVLWFSRREAVPQGAFVRDEMIVVRDGERLVKVCSLAEIGLPGEHNIENVLAAVTVAHAVGVKPGTMARVIRSFRGVEHRLELVRVIDGVRWVNDSIATSPDRTIAALRAFPEDAGRIILLAGGRDKHLPLDELAREIVVRVKYLVLFGEMAPKIEAAVKQAMLQANGTGRRVPIRRCLTLEEAVAIAAEVSESDDLVLLSPSGTSFDAFRDYEERGRRFKELVRRLPTAAEVAYQNRLARLASGAR